MADNTNKKPIPLPKQPFYQWFYDGKKTRKLIELLMSLEEQGDLGDVDLNNPELQAILQSLGSRISDIEGTLASISDNTDITTKITSLEDKAVEHDTSILSLLEDLASTVDRIENLEGFVQSPEGLTELVQRVVAIEDAISNLDVGEILPIPNSVIASALQ